MAIRYVDTVVVAVAGRETQAMTADRRRNVAIRGDLALRGDAEEVPTCLPGTTWTQILGAKRIALLLRRAAGVRIRRIARGCGNK